MTDRKKRLELTWIGKAERPRLEPRILLEDRELSYAKRVSKDDIFDNYLIHGDNLLALKALEQEFAGRVKCIYIDPPFNTGEAFDDYDDGLEHSLWLSLMRDRLELLHRLLASDGSFFVHIDDNELGYLIALVDEIFGRKNRIGVVTFKQSDVSGPKAINPGLVSTSSFILYYAKDKTAWRPNKVYAPVPRDKRYGQFIEFFEKDPSEWRLCSLREAFARSKGFQSRELKSRYADEDELQADIDQFTLANADRVVQLARVQPKDVSAEARAQLEASVSTPGRVFRAKRDGRSDVYFLDGKQIIFYASKVREIDGVKTAGLPLSTIWEDLPSNNVHQEGAVRFPNGKKPEALLKRIFELSTVPGDLVLDSFAGSGTTAAVAHKMRRRWITVELGEHCATHVLPRLRAVVDGKDETGVTGPTNWQGGGGFRFFKLAPSLLEKDKWGNWIVSKQYKPEMLAEAMCKLEGFRYAPDYEVFWNHGHSTERDFIYVTTQNLSPDQLRFISGQVGPERTLLICCGAFRGKPDFPNLTVKKIPQAVLARCEWGRDDYSLNVTEQAPAVAVEEAKTEESSSGTKTKSGGRRKKATPVQALPLFAGIGKGSK